MSLADDLAAANAGASQKGSRLTQGTCISIEWPLCTVNVGGGVQQMPITGYPPTVGWACWVAYFGTQPACIGPLARSPWGTVQIDGASGVVTIVGDDEVIRTVPYSDSLTLTAGDRVVTDWASGVAAFEPASESVPDVPDVPGGGGVTDHESVFYPIDSGSYSTAWFSDQVYASDSAVGAFFYSGIADTIPDTAEITYVGLFLNAVQVNVNASPNVGVHALTGKTGPLSVDSAVPVDPGSGWKVLPNIFGTVLANGDYLGLGIDHGGYTIFGAANDNNSGALVIRWRG